MASKNDQCSGLGRCEQMRYAQEGVVNVAAQWLTSRLAFLKTAIETGRCPGCGRKTFPWVPSR